LSITTQEQRRQLEAVGWEQIPTAGRCERWVIERQKLFLWITPLKDGLAVEFRPCEGYTNGPDLLAIVSVTASLQIPIPGYRIERVEEGAE
jgi:hypothetical protein